MLARMSSAAQFYYESGGQTLQKGLYEEHPEKAGHRAGILHMRNLDRPAPARRSRHQWTAYAQQVRPSARPDRQDQLPHSLAPAGVCRVAQWGS